VGVGEFYEGTGYVIDNTDPLERVDFSFERVRRRDIKRLIGKYKIRNKADRVALWERLAGESRIGARSEAVVWVRYVRSL
jgi:hypothetical protein